MDFSRRQFADVVVAVAAGRIDPVTALKAISGAALDAYDAHRRSADA